MPGNKKEEITNRTKETGWFECCVVKCVIFVGYLSVGCLRSTVQTDRGRAKRHRKQVSVCVGYQSVVC